MSSRNASLLLVLLLLVEGCGSKSKSDITPAELHVRSVLSEMTLLPLELKRNGRPIPEAELELIPSEAAAGAFAINKDGPLNAPPAIAFTPSWEGTMTATLVVRIDGDEYRIPVTGEGACLFEACPMHETSTLLSPTWSYSAPDTRRTLTERCAVAGNGNIYCVEWFMKDPSPDMPNDLFALSADGRELWRRSLGTSSGAGEMQVVGDKLLFTLFSSSEVRIHDQSDGAFVWSFQPNYFNNQPAPFVVVDTDRLVRAVLRDDGRFELRFHDLSTGQLLATVQPSVPDSLGTPSSMTPLALLTDARGNIFTSWQGIFDVPGGIREDSWGEILNASGESLAFASAVSDRSFFAMNVAMGDRLYSTSGRVLETSTLKEVSRLPWIPRDDVGPQMLLSPSRDGYVIHHGNMVFQECVEPSLKAFDATDQLRWACRPRDVNATVVLSADGGVMLVTNHFDKAIVRVFDAQGALQSQSQLTFPGLPGFTLSSGYVVSGGQLIAYVCPSAELGCRIASYAIPGFSVAPHGWVMRGGNPAQTSQPW